MITLRRLQKRLFREFSLEDVRSDDTVISLGLDKIDLLEVVIWAEGELGRDICTPLEDLLILSVEELIKALNTRFVGDEEHFEFR